MTGILLLGLSSVLSSIDAKEMSLSGFPRGQFLVGFTNQELREKSLELAQKESPFTDEVYTALSLSLIHIFNFNSMAAKYMGDGGNYMISWQDAVDMEKIPEQALDNPLYDDLREQILALPDVDAITSYDAVTVEIDLPRKADTFIITAMRREQFSQQLPDNRIAAGTADYDALAEGNGILISDSSDHIPVSYTHLDVYKRQA